MTTPTPPSQAAASRIDSLDILRGFMALSVAVYHFSGWMHLSESGTRANELTAILGHYGVEGFFIVSGFCFFHLYGEMKWDRRSLTDFHIKRFFRIAPLYYLAMLLNFVLQQHHADYTWANIAQNLTLTFGLSYKVSGFFHPNHSLVMGGWSIGLEYVFYMAFPILALLTRKKVMLYVLAIALVALAHHWSFGAVQAASHVGQQKFHTYVLLPNHAFLFLLGGIIAHLRGLTTRRLPVLLFLSLLALVVYVAIPQPYAFYDHFDVMAGTPRVKYVTLCFLIASLFAFFDVPRNALRKPLVLLGDASYSVYLLHPFVFLALTKIPPVHAFIANWPPLALFGLALVLTLTLATLVYRYMEKPAIRLGRRVAGRGSEKAPVT